MCVRVHCPVDARTCTHIWKYTNTHSHSHTYCANTRTNAARTDPHAHAKTHTHSHAVMHTHTIQTSYSQSNMHTPQGSTRKDNLAHIIARQNTRYLELECSSEVVISKYNVHTYSGLAYVVLWSTMESHLHLRTRNKKDASFV